MPRLLITLAALAAVITAPAVTPAAEPIKVLIITGDNIKGHDWPGTTQTLKDLLSEGGAIQGRRDVGSEQGSHRREPRQVRRAPAQLQGDAGGE